MSNVNGLLNYRCKTEYWEVNMVRVLIELMLAILRFDQSFIQVLNES